MYIYQHWDGVLSLCDRLIFKLDGDFLHIGLDAQGRTDEQLGHRSRMLSVAGDAETRTLTVSEPSPEVWARLQAVEADPAQTPYQIAQARRHAYNEGRFVTLREAMLVVRGEDPDIGVKALCPACHGSSYDGEDDCPACGGTGTVIRAVPA